MEIHIHATVSSNSIRYFDYVCENYTGLSSGKIPLFFYAYCLDKESHRELSHDKRIHQAVGLEFGRGSTGHAKSIDTAIANFALGQINIISDTDIAILMKNWDVSLEKALCGPSAVGVVATKMEGLGGFNCGNIPIQHYKEKPTTTWMAISPQFDFSRLSVMPDKENYIAVNTPGLADLYQIPVGFQVLKDTGWQIPAYLKDNNIPYLSLDIVKPTSAEAIALKGCNPYHDEFHWDGKPFLAHQRGSMKHRFRIDPLSQDFYDACDRYLGNPAWAVHPTAKDRQKALMQDAINLAKTPFRVAKRLVAR